VHESDSLCGLIMIQGLFWQVVMIAGYGDIRTARRGEALIEGTSGLGTVNLQRFSARPVGFVAQTRWMHEAVANAPTEDTMWQRGFKRCAFCPVTYPARTARTSFATTSSPHSAQAT